MTSRTIIAEDEALLLLLLTDELRAVAFHLKKPHIADRIEGAHLC